MNDDDLRDKLTTALTECSGADIEEDLDALMPVIREALAAAWDDGFDVGCDELFRVRAERAEAERDEIQAVITELRAERHRAEADLAALRNRIGSIAGVLRCVDAPAASMIQDALDGGDPK